MNATIQFFRNLRFGTAFLFMVSTQTLYSQSYPQQITNGQVTAMALNTSTGILYLGGLFTHLNVSVTGSFVPLNESDGHPEEGWPLVEGSVFNAIPDGNGGWFICGSIYKVGGVARTGIAQINAAKQVTNWNPNANASVKAMILVANTLYVSGSFTNIGGVTRRGFAALDATTGIATGFNSDPIYYGGEITTMALSGNTLFVGGRNITTIMGVPRKNLASFDLATGSITGWNPGADSDINTIVTNGITIYVGGQFNIIAGKAQPSIASFDITTGSITGWNPQVSTGVTAIAINGNRAYLGGPFTIVRGQIRFSGLAAVNTTGLGTAISSWASSSTLQFDANTIQTIAVNNNAVYVGGRFKSFEGLARNGLAAFDLSNGTLLGWNPNSNKKGVDTDRFIWIHTILVQGSKVFTGGDFETVGGQPRNFMGAIDVATSKETSWNPNADSYSESFALSGNTVYVGGFFTKIGGLTQKYLAALDANTGSTTGWNPNASGAVKGIAVVGNNVYVGGQFTTIGGVARNRLAALDATTGLATNWNPALSGNVEIRTLKINGNSVYVGGQFATVGGMLRSNAAAVDATTGNALGWNPGVYPKGDWVNDIEISGNTAYLGGKFTTVSGITRNRLAAVDATTGVATNWNPNADNEVMDLAVKDDLVYAVGGLQKIGTIIRRYMVALDAVSGGLTTWYPNANLSSVFAPTKIIADGNVVYLAGSSVSTSSFPGSWLGKTSDFLLRTDGSGSLAPIVLTSATISGLGGVSSVNINGSLQMVVASFPPANANTNTTPVWSVSNPARATINSQTGLLTGVSVGIVTVTGTFGSVLATKVISITNQTIPVTSATISGFGGASVVTITSTLQLTSTFSPSNANSNTAIVWNSSNNNIATIDEGLLSAINEGIVTITGTYGSISAFYVVTVIGYPRENQVLSFNSLPTHLTYGDAPITLIATVNSGLPITFSSDNTNIAFIDGNTLVIKGGGTVNVSANVVGNATYNPASVVQILQIAKVELTVTGISASRYYGQPLTQSFVFQIEGLIK